MLKNNDIIEVEITDLTKDAMGVGHYDGLAVFVANAVPGDIVNAKITKVKPTLAYAQISSFNRKSSERQTPPCPAFDSCGGCQLMHMKYEAQINLKKKFIFDALTRIGNVPENIKIDMISAVSPLNYRNKMVFPIGNDKKGSPVCGFYKIKSHDIVPLNDCPLGIVKNDKIIKTILEYMNKYKITVYDEKTGKGLLRRLFIRHGINKNETMVVISANAKSIPHEREITDSLLNAEKSIKSIILNINTKQTNLVLGSDNKVLWGNPVIHDTLCGFEYEISPHSFFQINPAQTEKLYDKAIEYADIQKDETVLDLYCGIGTISLAASKYAKNVVGVEIVPEAIENAKKNALKNNITNCTFLAGKAEDIAPKLIKDNLSPQKVILDPPRKGSDEKTLAAICSTSPKSIVYVSCNPATLARDIKFVSELGYKVEKVTGVDMFPNTIHVECVVLMSRTE